MSELPARCVPCDGDTPALSEGEARAHHADTPRWELDFVGAEIPRLARSFVMKDFRDALAWINRVGMLAEEEGHHPDLHIRSWNRVEIVLWTHAVGGLSINDFVLARKIDALAAKDGR